jgi:hypothetical protein
MANLRYRIVFVLEFGFDSKRYAGLDNALRVGDMEQ